LIQLYSTRINSLFPPSKGKRQRNK
jgi:hypothetical protein